MSSPSIRIMDDIGSLPEVEIANDIGASIDIGSIDALDMGLLANQKKLNSPATTRPISPAPMSEIKSDDIEFVNLEDVGNTSVSFDLKPAQTSASSDSIHILRDSSAPPPARPFSSAPAPATRSWFSSESTADTSAASSGSSSGGGGIGSTFRNWFGGGGSSNTEDASANLPEIRHSEYLTPEQEFVKKTEALNLLERMDKRGIVGNKMTMANSLTEIQGEVERRKDSKALEASLRFQRSMLTTVTNGLEFLNSRFDPLGVRLDGWSEQVNENIEDYDEIFEELYDKYKDKTKVAPEVRLVMSLGLSAAMCHVTNTMFKSKMPGMDDILRNRPDLARQFAQAAAQEAVGPGFANFVGLGMDRRGPAPPPSSHPGGPASAFGSMFADAGPSSRVPPPPTQTARREMRGPSGVEDILQKLNQAGETLPERAVPPPASPMGMGMGMSGGIDADEIHSVRSGFTSATTRARRKPASIQPVGASLTLNV